MNKRLDVIAFLKATYADWETVTDSQIDRIIVLARDDTDNWDALRAASKWVLGKETI